MGKRVHVAPDDGDDDRPTTMTQESYSTLHSDWNVAHLGDFSLRQCGIPRLPPRALYLGPDEEALS